jgi:hypothetical protein
MRIARSFDGTGRFAWLLAAWLLLWGFRAAPVAAAEFMDRFADRQTILEPAGQLQGDNSSASIEPNEPRHGRGTGGHSVWISWIAPADGVATFRTEGSDFDTLLAAYTFDKPEDTALDRLKPVARDDDDPSSAPASLIQFGALAGKRYEIAVDGYRGATGSIRLRWEFANAAAPPPIVISVPEDRAARLGDPVTLTVSLSETEALDLQWRLNGNSIGATGPTLVIPSLQPADLGRYTLRIRIGDVRFETQPVEVQINSDGQTNALARDKIFDAAESPLIGVPPAAPGLRRLSRAGALPALGVVRGYNGSQIFNTTFATRSPEEPAHCGRVGGGSYWFAYQPPQDGTLTLDTVGSVDALGQPLDTILAVYTVDGPLNRYADLVPVTCDLDGAGQGASRVEFAVVATRRFFVVVEGEADARGIVHLNYSLDTERVPQPPTLTAPVAPTSVAAGSDVTLQASVAGTPPLRFRWSKDGQPLSDATNATLRLTQVQPAHSGEYVLTVSNLVGPPLQVSLPLRVLLPPVLQLTVTPEGPRLSFPTVLGQRYAIEEAPTVNGPWERWPEAILGDGLEHTLTNLVASTTHHRFWRLKVE